MAQQETRTGKQKVQRKERGKERRMQKKDAKAHYPFNSYTSDEESLFLLSPQ